MAAATKSEYKMTEVGLIPSDWEEVKLNEIGKFNKGSGVKKDDARSGELACIRYGEIYTFHNYFIREFNSFISSSIAGGAKQLKKGDILFAGSGETKEEIGKCVSFLFDFEAYAGGDIVILSPNSSDSLFLGYLLNSTPINKQKANRGQGDAVVHISASQLGEIKIPLPPLPEQTAIATALKDTDDLINSLENLIAKKKLIKQGAMQELLKPKEGWVKKKLGEVIKLQVGYPFDSGFFNQDAIGVRLVKNRDLKNDDQIYWFSSNYPSSFIVNNGDLLVGMDGDFVICKWKKGTALLNQRVGRINRIGNINLDFLLYYLEKYLYEIQDITSATTVKHLSHNEIEKLELFLPNKYFQTEIANCFVNIDIELNSLEIKLSKLQTIKQGMMQQLLTGKIRLV